MIDDEKRGSRPTMSSLVLIALSSVLTAVVLVLTIVDGRLSAGVVLVGLALIAIGTADVYGLVRRASKGPGLLGWVFAAQLVLVLCWLLVATPQQLGGAS